MNFTYEDLEIDGQTIPTRVLNPDGRGTILFLHGFARDPRDYSPYLERLAKAEDARIIAPFLYANGRLERPPRTIAECIDWTDRVCRALGDRGDLSPGYDVIGHSTGGLVAQAIADIHPRPARILALNPIFPVRYGAFGFIPRALRIGARQLCGRTAPISRALAFALRTGGRMLYSLLRNPAAAWSLIQSISRVRMEDLRAHYDARGAAGSKIGVPVRVLVASGDEFFEPPLDARAWLEVCFDQFEHVQLDAPRGHEWPLLHPEPAAAEAHAWRMTPVEPEAGIAVTTPLHAPARAGACS